MPDGPCDCWLTVELGYVDRLSHETERETLEKTNSSRGVTNSGSYSPQANAAFVSQMEEVLVVYTRPYDPKRPMSCMDEASNQVVGEALGYRYRHGGADSSDATTNTCVKG